MANVLVDIGSYSEIMPSAINHLDITVSPPADASRVELQPLTPELRADLAQRLTGSILKLAATYQDTTAFRDVVLRSCPRGIELEQHYDANLSAMYAVAVCDTTFVHRASVAWLDVHPYVAAMTRIAQGDTESANVKLTPEQFRACMQVFEDFKNATVDSAFREVLPELIAELASYEGLSAEAALQQLRATPPRRPPQQA